MFRRLVRGGAEGNARLTAATALALLALLAVEGVTLLFLGSLLPVHVFVGLMLVPPVLLKLGVTGWRFMRYYQSRPEYVRKGPPHPLMRFVVAPALVLSTIGVLGTGVAMVAFGAGGAVIGLHKASFVIWSFAFGIHVLVYLPRIWHAVRSRMRGGAARIGLVGAAVVVGAAIAVAALPAARPWMHYRQHDHGEAASARR